MLSCENCQGIWKSVASRDSVRRRQLHYSDGQLTRGALALRRVSGPRRAIYRLPSALLRSAACQLREAPAPHGPNGSDRRRSTLRAQQ
jgi:hypothetical protein